MGYLNAVWQARPGSHSSITEHSLHGITPSKKGKSVTYVSGTPMCPGRTRERRNSNPQPPAQRDGGIPTGRGAPQPNQYLLHTLKCAGRGACAETEYFPGPLRLRPMATPLTLLRRGRRVHTFDVGMAGAS